MKGLVFLFALATAQSVLTVTPILRPNRPNPSCNAYVVWDSTQVLLVDVGKVDDDWSEVTNVLTPLLEDNARTLRGVFITHGHPDHVGQVYRVAQELQVPIFVASQEVKVEMANIMRLFGWRLFNASSPSNTFDYAGPTVQVVTDSARLWKGDRVVIHNGTLPAETNHYAWLEITSAVTSEVHLFVGDLVYHDTHMFMGLDVSLMAQCDWIRALGDFAAYVETIGLPDITLYPGHGAPTTSIGRTIADNVAYIEFARSVYVGSCNATAAAANILAKFPSYNDPVLLEGFSAPFRVPGDAVNLGCVCSATVSSCDIAPPPCVAMPSK
jgi:glyoxylase-like metal-dependent hydrolase (beta-lactamase superfamily II)